jgi:hypothetical protein
MKLAWIVIMCLVAGYLVGQLMMIWRTRNDVPPPPPGGWRKGSFDDEEQDEPPRRLPPP